jgi:YgiT-type zinc finger domain-containing protein
MKGKIQLKSCPTCGSGTIQWVVRDVTRKCRGRTYTVPALEFYDCPSCGEKVYDRDAMLKIQAHSPAYRRGRVSDQVGARKTAVGAARGRPAAR